ncbi:MAG: hypothetical protein ABEJ71_01225 [Halodesulfurarchaeum sp.]
MSGPEMEDSSLSEPVDLWCRWTDTFTDKSIRGDSLLAAVDIHVHQFCDVWPLDRGPEASSDVDFTPSVKFLDGYTRQGLRYTPQIIGVVTLFLLVSAELSPEMAGVSALLPPIRPIHLLILGAGSVVWVVMGWIFVDSGLISLDEIVRVTVVYGLFFVLGLGTAFSIWRVFSVQNRTALEPNVVYASGYLLMLLIGGLLVYDGMLKTENLLANLDRKLIVPDDRKQSYRDFETNVLRDELSMTTTIPGIKRAVKTRNLIAPLFVAQFGVVWALGHGPQNLDSAVLLATNLFLDVFIVIVAFQFLLLIYAIYRLLHAGQYPAVPGDSEILRTVPFHPDGFGGFRDLGQFATRVNVLLIMAGLYLAYRLYVQGFRVDPAAMIPGAGSGLSMAVWGVSFIGPVVAYLGAAIAWFYYSFYQMHVKMAHDREEAYIELKMNQRESRDGNQPARASSRPMGEINEGQDWIEMRNSAPVWPVDSRRLRTLISGTFAPIVLSLPRFLF